jgi:hypothetical protein
METQLETFASVQRWFRQLRKKSGDNIIPYDTRRCALDALSAFTTFTKMNPDQLIEDAKNQLKQYGSVDKHNDMLDQYWDEASVKTTAIRNFNMIRSFYKRNGILLTTTSPKTDPVRTNDIILSSDMIRKICDNAPIQHASWMLANSYMGLRIGAIPLLIKDDFLMQNWNEDRALYPVRIGKKISGTFEYVTFIGHDAKTKLQAHFRVCKDNNPWNYDKNYLIRMFKIFAYKAGVVDAPNGADVHGVPKGMCPLRTHAFRKRVQTVLEGAHVPLNWVDYMLGHVPRGAQAAAYSRPQPEELYPEYLKALPLMEIYGHHAQSPIIKQVADRKQAIFDQLQIAFGIGQLSKDKLDQIKNILAKAHTEKELDSGIQNVMAMTT